MENESTTPLPAWVQDCVSALDDKMGLRLTEVSADRVAGAMPVEGNTHPYMIWHGGASAVLIETLASLGATCAGRPDRIGMGVDLNVTHLRPVLSGWVHGVAIPLRIGRSTVTYQVDLSDDHGHRIAVGRLTCKLVELPEEFS